jgi:PPM family protein phosphatase
MKRTNAAAPGAESIVSDIDTRSGTAAGISHRRGHTEDARFIGRRLFAVADGISKYPDGAQASAAAIGAVRQLDRMTIPPSGRNHELRQQIDDDLRHRVAGADRAIWERGAQLGRGHEAMGTTLTALYLDSHHAIVIHIGDSRAYRLRNGECVQLTRDHANGATLTRRLGGRFRPREERDRQWLASRHPDIGHHACYSGDRYLLCTDGINKHVTDAAIAHTLSRHNDPQHAADELLKKAYKDHGRFEDDATCVVVFVQ